MRALSPATGVITVLAACSAAHAVDCKTLYNDSRVKLIVQIEAEMTLKDRYPGLSLPPNASLVDKREFLERLRAVIEMEQRRRRAFAPRSTINAFRPTRRTKMLIVCAD
jgi:hypothetical protein